MQLPAFLTIAFGLFTIVTLFLLFYNHRKEKQVLSKKSNVRMLIIIAVIIPVAYFTMSHIYETNDWILKAFYIFAIIWAISLFYYIYETFKRK
jgi:uncharacterized membrane protein